MIKIISALICFVLLISVNPCALSEINNIKMVNSIKKIPHNKIVFDINDINESKTADNKNANENEKDEDQLTLTYSLNTSFVKFKLYGNFYSITNLYSYNSAVPQSPPDC